METGVKVVGGVPNLDTEEETTDVADLGTASPDVTTSPGQPPRPTSRRPGGTPSGPSRRAFRIVTVVAIVGVLGTLLFGILYATTSSGTGQDPAVTATARTFLTNFFNFNAKSVDSDFNQVESMATGAFSTQAQQFFNANIRKALEQALAESRGQIRALYVQSETPTSATIYAVVDQTYVNNKITTPQADVVRLVVNLTRVGSTWKISNVTVLEGASPASAGSASGSAGSTVPGQ
jgi:hypothetical protein